MSHARTLLYNWWPTAIVVAVILYATLSSDPLPDDELPMLPGLDKLIHSVMFGGLFGAICFDRYRSGGALSRRFVVATAIVCTAAGGVIELLQIAMHNGRAGDWWDFAADTLGVIVAVFTAPPTVKKVLKRR